LGTVNHICLFVPEILQNKRFINPDQAGLINLFSPA